MKRSYTDYSRVVITLYLLFLLFLYRGKIHVAVRLYIVHCIYMNYDFKIGGTLWRSWLRYCCTSRKVTGLIPDGVIGISHLHNPSNHTVALGSTQTLTEIST
jgi:hypothetical protein